MALPDNGGDLFRGATFGLERRLPLAARMRPMGLDEILGQEHILGPGRLLRRAIEADRITSLILFGPPGCGKTSLAEVIARTTRRRFVRTSGATANVTELRSILHSARARESSAGRVSPVEGQTELSGTILFIDEIHRFSKSQQDVLLPYVEDGTVTLIGATAHNPLFYITAPLISRSLVFELAPLSEQTLCELLNRALKDERLGAARKVVADPDALAHIAKQSEGDARRALNALEIAVLSTRLGSDGVIRVTRAIAEDSIQKKAVVYDHDEDGHFDTISAFIKSVRGSDPHAAIYWLAKMLYAGEDPRFIARRLVVLASEDIGNADPRGLTVAVSALHAVEFVGMPEARIILAQATAYLATAPKSNAAYRAVEHALRDVREGRVHAVPEALKNVSVRKADGALESAAEYLYPHDYERHFVPQQYMPGGAKYYIPSLEGYEEIIARRMRKCEEQAAQAGSEASGSEKGSAHPGDSDRGKGSVR